MLAVRGSFAPQGKCRKLNSFVGNCLRMSHSSSLFGLSCALAVSQHFKLPPLHAHSMHTAWPRRAPHPRLFLSQSQQKPKCQQASPARVLNRADHLKTANVICCQEAWAGPSIQIPCSTLFPAEVMQPNRLRLQQWAALHSGQSLKKIGRSCHTSSNVQWTCVLCTMLLHFMAFVELWWWHYILANPCHTVFYIWTKPLYALSCFVTFNWMTAAGMPIHSNGRWSFCGGFMLGATWQRSPERLKQSAVVRGWVYAIR